MTTLNEILKAHNEKGLRFVQRDEDEEPERDETIDELSDAEYHGLTESFRQVR